MRLRRIGSAAERADLGKEPRFYNTGRRPGLLRVFGELRPVQNFLLLTRRSIAVKLPARLRVCTPATCGPQLGIILSTSTSSYASALIWRMRLIETAYPYRWEQS